MNEYRCTPKKNARPAVILCTGLLVSSFASFFASSLLPTFRGLGQLVAAILLMFFVYLSNRYLLTEYTYSLEENTLFLTLVQGKRIRHPGGVPITEQSVILTKEEWKWEKRNIL